MQASVGARPRVEVPVSTESPSKAAGPPSPDSLCGPKFEINTNCGLYGASGPLPSPGETLVGVVDSSWPLHNPRGLFPGDILLRIGRRGQPGTIRAPFPHGLKSVRKSLEHRDSSEDVVLVQVLRGSSKLELLVSPTKSEGADKALPSVQDVDYGEELSTPDTLYVESLEEAVFEGVKLAEGKHADFAPLAARTEYCILRLERMKAYGFQLDPMPPSSLGVDDGDTRISRSAMPLSHGGSGSNADGNDSMSDSGSSDSEGQECKRRDMSRNQAGSLLTVAPSVLPSDPTLEVDEDDLVAGSFAFRFDRPGGQDRFIMGESNYMVGSPEFSLRHPEVHSGPLGISTQSAPGTSAPEEVDELRASRDSGMFRLYTRPTSPRKALVRHSSQPDMLAAKIPSDVLQHQLSNSPPRKSAAPTFQIKRRSIPEASLSKSGKEAGHVPSSLFTILVLPSESTTGNNGLGKSSNGLHRRFSDLNHTVERAMRWFQGAKSSGVAMDLKSAQTEVLPLRLGGMDNQKLAKVAQYGKWIVKTGAGDSARGDHVSVLRAVRLWLVPANEVELTLCLSSKEDSCPDWGIQLALTPQGIVHVASVAVGSAADKAGVGMLLRMAEAKCQLLAVTKIQSHVVIPSMISDDGIESVDIDAIREQLLLHAHLQSPLQLTLAL